MIFNIHGVQYSRALICLVYNINKQNNGVLCFNNKAKSCIIGFSAVQVLLNFYTKPLVNKIFAPKCPVPVWRVRVKAISALVTMKMQILPVINIKCNPAQPYIRANAYANPPFIVTAGQFLVGGIKMLYVLYGI